jgi:hypothetical protein
MPIKGARYRWVDPGKPGGPKVRLAFKGKGKVVEAKSTSGKIHTPKEFAADRLKRKAKKRNKK